MICLWTYLDVMSTDFPILGHLRIPGVIVQLSQDVASVGDLTTLFEILVSL